MNIKDIKVGETYLFSRDAHPRPRSHHWEANNTKETLLKVTKIDFKQKLLHVTTVDDKCPDLDTTKFTAIVLFGSNYGTVKATYARCTIAEWKEAVERVVARKMALGRNTPIKFDTEHLRDQLLAFVVKTIKRPATGRFRLSTPKGLRQIYVDWKNGKHEFLAATLTLNPHGISCTNGRHMQAIHYQVQVHWTERAQEAPLSCFRAMGLLHNRLRSNDQYIRVDVTDLVEAAMMAPDPEQLTERTKLLMDRYTQ
jgi:hypothetical protein